MTDLADGNARALLSGHVIRLLLMVRQQAERVLEGEPFDTAQLDAWLFVYAVRDVRLGAAAAKRWAPERMRAALDEFDARVPGVKDVRDIQAHFDEYEGGTGRLQRQGIAKAPVRWLERGDRTAVIWVLPFRLEVHTAHEAAGSLAGEALEVLHA